MFLRWRTLRGRLSATDDVYEPGEEIAEEPHGVKKVVICRSSLVGFRIQS